MADKILLDNRILKIEEKDLPCLVSYDKKVGGSHFTISMVANLFLKGSKIIFLTAYPMAKDNFLQQTKGKESEINYITNEKQFDTDAQAIILESGNEKLFWKIIKRIDNLQKHVVLIKNMEMFSNEILDFCLKLQKIIISGDIDKCSNKQIREKKFKTTIIFTKPEIKLPFNPPSLKKYKGYLWSKDKEGYVTVQIEK